MKILVLSDSHSSLSYMKRCIQSVSPDCVVHLGDHYDDGLALLELFPKIKLYQVPGNCDLYRCPPFAQEKICEKIGGIWVYFTHGHRHGVKQRLDLLVNDARKCKADVVLYGHTHVADCHKEEDGLWVLNPGSCGYYGGSAGLIETHGGEISKISIVRSEDLEEIR